jgi:acetylornithine deacetylase/succinyl-diaminopimelate desuccinylase-like protein
MYDFLRSAERMLATPSVTSDGTAEVVDYVLRSVVPDLPGDSMVMAEPDGRDVNVLVVVSGKEDEQPLLLNSHLDTVPPGEPRAWTATGGDPFRPRLDGDRLIGLGSADAKLDWLCKAEAIRRSARAGLNRPIYLLGTYGEERGLIGARSFLENAVASRPAAALVGEPTECRLVTRHKGLLMARLGLVALSRELAQVALRVRVRRYAGRAAHSATPENGDSAVLKALSDLADETPVVAIRGGDAVNRVPARCEVEVAISCNARASGRAATGSASEVRPMSPALLMAARDFAGALLVLAEQANGEGRGFQPPGTTVNIGRIEGRGEALTLAFDVRPLPGSDVRVIRAKLEAIASEIEGNYAGVSASLAIERKNPALVSAPPGLVDMALDAMRVVGLPRAVGTMAGCTEAGLYADRGIPAVVFGAGRAAGNIHAPNEWTSITQLQQAVEFYTAFIEAYCGRR